MIAILDREKLIVGVYSSPVVDHRILNHALRGEDLIKNFYHDKALLLPLIGYNHEPKGSLEKGENIYDLPNNINYVSMFLKISLDALGVQVEGIGSGQVEEGEKPTRCFTPMGYLNEISTLVFGKSKWLVQQLSNRLAHKDLTKEEICNLIHDIVYSLDGVTILSIARDQIATFLEEAEKDLMVAFVRYWECEYKSNFESIVYYTLDNVPILNEENLLGNPRERYVK